MAVRGLRPSFGIAAAKGSPVSWPGWDTTPPQNGSGTPEHAPSPDLARDFNATKPDRRWAADITEFPCWDFTCSWSGSKTFAIRGTRQTTDLVVSALVTDLGVCRPDDES